ncbi:NAD-dependent protein deacetylase [Lysobacter korlensis]|uniref:NAD-dependent protein deacetylase n=1 Tax=Lysobacter korlensis TaxID=553636 RepID=A0ABV6RN09_9GAMM
MNATPEFTEDVEALSQWLEGRARVFVLTGAGCSTSSGIPDYRDLDGSWKRKPPVTYQAFIGEAATRQRYWARSFVGWPMFSEARPNAAHHALAGWQRAGGVSMLLTQNVDGLHQKAGSIDVIDLHGRLDEVRCLQCDYREARASVQATMAAANPGWTTHVAMAAPDGDADLEHADIASFRIPDCPVCGGLLKPDVVFFGENVPLPRVQAAQRALERSDGMLVVGSSLMVYSGYRFARMANAAGIEIAIATRGATRADDLASLKCHADCTALVPAVLGARAGGHRAADPGAATSLA